jgi:hypothetical protein
MTTTPAWSPTDNSTADILALVADVDHPSVDREWDDYRAAVASVADTDGRVDPNALREAVRGKVAPRRIGALTNRALSLGLLVWRGEWCVSSDREGRNAGRPCRQYVWTGAAS